MQRTIKAVIGANFGDEGKGLMTDYLADQMQGGIVVRFNGGAQAGHTVVTPGGKRHVFGHFGSGTLAGLPCYLSSFFVVNPMLFHKEAASLKKLGALPRVYLDRNCVVTTPYDMMINQISEIARGSFRHGSCGVGFNETITRSLQDDFFKLTVQELGNQSLVAHKIQSIKKLYVPNRLKQLGVLSVPDSYLHLLADDHILDRYLEDAAAMLDRVTITDTSVLTGFDAILFEGAQGLLLDQSHPYFPHVTRSNTGMQNVAALLKQTGLETEPLEIIYATRSYLTRHGAGPFPTELSAKPYPKIKDLTNIPNPYQGKLRFGLLDIDALAETIGADLRHAANLNYTVKIAITCLDQLEDKADFISDSRRMKASVENFIAAVLAATGVKSGYGSYGPARDTILQLGKHLTLCD